MLAMPRGKPDLEIKPRIRVIRDGSILMGPGKADLLEAIERTGSIRKASEELGMSYMRAWTLVKAMNDGFRDPVVESSRGGAGRGHRPWSRRDRRHRRRSPGGGQPGLLRPLG